ncbi:MULTISPECIES: fimbrial protein [unclassified Pseudomonas]|uniref:fimbrial protein n=1 Tax=unclassified Pseudomonas TaxID=196821 RepID=UPI000A1DF27C|nr:MULTISPECIES: fimbrial protein [unclassified Pseudomonas]
MKKTLMVLALSLASSTAFAADEEGKIIFKGHINGGTTCPIEVVEPGLGGLGWVDLGIYPVKYFASNASTTDVPFALRIEADSTCTIAPGTEATVKFDSANGDAGASGEYYKIRTAGADGLALEIKDEDYKSIPPRTDSKKYPVTSTGTTDMRFYASLTKTGTVTDGAANADLSFVVTLP